MPRPPGPSPRRTPTASQPSPCLHTEFLGYERLNAEATITGLPSGGEAATSAGEGGEVELVLDRSPFYAETGGQIGDTGNLTLT